MGSAPRVTERRYRAGGVGSRVLEVAGDGPPLLLLHGYSDSADTWRPLMLELATRGQRSIAIDLPGFGAADRLDPEGSMVEQLLSFVDASIGVLLRPDDPAPIIAGNSMGGLVSLLAAERRPAPAAVVPIGPAGFDHPRWFQILNGQPLLRLLLSDTAPVPRALVTSITGEVFRQLAFARPRRASREVLRRYASHYRSSRDVRRLLHTGRRLLAEIVDPFHHERIGCPVVLVWGAKDRMVSIAGARHLVDALPGMRFERLESAGHCPQLEVPGRVAEILLDVCADVATGTPVADEAPAALPVAA